MEKEQGYLLERIKSENRALKKTIDEQRATIGNLRLQRDEHRDRANSRFDKIVESRKAINYYNQKIQKLERTIKTLSPIKIYKEED